jgi:hypothetical protein
MKSGDVKTKKQNNLVFLSDTPVRLNFPGAILSYSHSFIFARLDSTLPKPNSLLLDTSLTFHRLREINFSLSALAVPFNPLA